MTKYKQKLLLWPQVPFKGKDKTFQTFQMLKGTKIKISIWQLEEDYIG